MNKCRLGVGIRQPAPRTSNGGHEPTTAGGLVAMNPSHPNESRVTSQHGVPCPRTGPPSIQNLPISAIKTHLESSVFVVEH